MQPAKRPGNAESSTAARPIVEQAAAENDDVSSDEDEVLEESPCGRWQKRKDEVGGGTRFGQFFFSVLKLFTSMCTTIQYSNCVWRYCTVFAFLDVESTTVENNFVLEVCRSCNMPSVDHMAVSCSVV